MAIIKTKTLFFTSPEAGYDGRRGGLYKSKLDFYIESQDRTDMTSKLTIEHSIWGDEKDSKPWIINPFIYINGQQAKVISVTGGYNTTINETGKWIASSKYSITIQHDAESGKILKDLEVSFSHEVSHDSIGRINTIFTIPKEEVNPIKPHAEFKISMQYDSTKLAVLERNDVKYNYYKIECPENISELAVSYYNVSEKLTSKTNNEWRIYMKRTHQRGYSYGTLRVKYTISNPVDGDYTATTPWFSDFVNNDIRYDIASVQYPKAPTIKLVYDTVGGKKPDKPYIFSNAKVVIEPGTHPAAADGGHYVRQNITLDGNTISLEDLSKLIFNSVGKHRIAANNVDDDATASGWAYLDFNVLNYIIPDMTRPKIVRGADKTSLIATYNLKYTPIISGGKDINKGTLRIQVPASNYDKSFEISTSTKEFQNELLGAKLRETIGSNITFTYTDITGASNSETVYVETDQSVVFTYNKNGIGIKKEITRGALDVHGDIYTDGHYKLGDGRIIPEERVVAPGGSVWYGDADTNIREEQNTRFNLWSATDNPSGGWGPALNVWTGGKRGIQQVWGYNGRVFVRTSNNTNAWKWTPWKEYAWKDDITAVKKYVDDMQPKTITKQNIALGYGLQGDFYKTGNVVRVYFHGSFSENYSSEVKNLGEVLDEDLRPERDLRLTIIPASTSSLRHWGDGGLSGARLATMELLVFPDGHMKQYVFNVAANTGLTGSAIYWTNN